RVLPGVEGAAVTLSLPPNQLVLTNPFTVRGQAYDPKRPLPLAEEMTVSADYFSTLGVRLISGRTFNNSDRTSGHRVMVINRSMATHYFPGQDPIGREVQTGDPDPSAPSDTIIGLV